MTRGASRMLLLTDIASRTPVLVDRTDARAILLGDGGGHPRLSFLRGQNPVKQGDRILTSGDGGVFPRGLPVGVAVKGLDGQWRVQLDSDLTAIDFVRILRFKDFTDLADEKQLDATEMPPLVEDKAGSARTAVAAPKPASKPAALTPAAAEAGRADSTAPGVAPRTVADARARRLSPPSRPSLSWPSPPRPSPCRPSPRRPSLKAAKPPPPRVVTTTTPAPPASSRPPGPDVGHELY